MKLEFDDFPRWLNPKLSHKQIKECYEEELRRIDRKHTPRYCCIATDDSYLNLQRSINSDFITRLHNNGTRRL